MQFIAYTCVYKYIYLIKLRDITYVLNTVELLLSRKQTPEMRIQNFSNKHIILQGGVT